MAARWLPFVPLLLVSCGTVRNWRELQTDPMPVGEVFDGVAHIANGDGLVSDASVTDRGMGVWQSRWRTFVMPVNRHPGRYRLRVEVLLDEGSADQGWPVRYVVEREHVDDLRRSIEPREQDWSSAGQDAEKEALIGDRLARRLAPQAYAGRGSGGRAP